MPNGNKNNGKKEIELLPEELRRPEERKRREERPEVKLFIPPVEAKPEKPSFIGKFFGAQKTPATPKPEEKRKINGSENLSVFGMQKEIKKPVPPPPKQVPPSPPPQPRPVPPPPKQVPPKPVKSPVVGKGFSEPRSRIGITLIPEETLSPEEAARPKQKAILIAVIVVLAVILGGIFGILKWYQNKAKADLENINKDIVSIEKQIKDLDSEKNRAEVLQKQFRVAEKLLAKHVYWSGVCSFLEKNTISDVYFKNFVGGNDGQIVMSAVAKSYRAVAEQIVAFSAAENIEKVSITSATASVSTTGETAEVNFEAKLRLNQEIFFK